MLTIRALIICFVYYATSAFAISHAVEHAPYLLVPEQEQNEWQIADTDFTLESQQARNVYLPSGHWLDIPTTQLTNLRLWQSYNTYSKRSIVREELVCTGKFCRINASNDNRVLHVENKTDTSQTIAIVQGHYQIPPDLYNHHLALPSQALHLQSPHQTNTYYFVEENKPLSIRFDDAAKLKISVRKLLGTPSQLSKSNKIYLSINEIPSAILPLSDTQALEYKKQKISISSIEYLAVNDNSKLTIQSDARALIQIEQAQRAFLDFDSAQKDPESLLQPYWIDALENDLQTIYGNKDLSILNNFDYAKASALAKKRHQQLRASVTQNLFLNPTESDQVVKSRYQQTHIQSGVRHSEQQVYPTLVRQSILSHTIQNTLTFKLNNEAPLNDNLNVYVRVKHEGKLKVQLDERTFELHIQPHEAFSVFTFNTQQATQLTLQTPTEIEVAVRQTTISPLVNNELLYVRPTKLADKSPTIRALLANYQAKAATQYLNALPNYQASPYKQNMSQHETDKLLSEARRSLRTAPIQTMQISKQLVQSTLSEVALQAWQLRIAALEQLGQANIATRYLEALLKSSNLISSNAKLNEYAKQQLLLRYQAANQHYKLIGLCSLKTRPDWCATHLSQLYYANQQALLAAWHIHDVPPNTKESHKIYQSLGYQYLSNVDLEEKPNYQLIHYGQVALDSESHQYQAFRLSHDQAITLTAFSPLTLKVTARSIAHAPDTFKTNWLYINSTEQPMSIMPIYADIPSTTVEQTGQSLSIAASGFVTLKQGETITIKSSEISFLTLRALDPQSALVLFDNDLSPAYFAQSFADLLRKPDATMAMILNNALHRLCENKFTAQEFTSLFVKLGQHPVANHLKTLHRRVSQYGQWQNMATYTSFLGTRLLPIENNRQRSVSDQVTRHTTKNGNLAGIALRPFKKLTLDISEFIPKQSKLRLSLSSAELDGAQHAQVIIQSQHNSRTYSLTEQVPVEHVLSQQEISFGTITLHWDKPYLSHLLTIEVLSEGTDGWQAIKSKEQQRFYTADKHHPIILDLQNDALLKIEYMYQDKRTEVFKSYVAGHHQLPQLDAEGLRVQVWQLSANNHKLPIHQTSKTVENKDTNTPFKTDSGSLNTLTTTTRHQKRRVNIEGYLTTERQGASDFEDQLPQVDYTTFGMTARYNEHDFWYKLGLAKQNSDHYDSTYQLSAALDWLSPHSDWYTQSDLEINWQPAQDTTSSFYSTKVGFLIGQRWQNNRAATHRWWWQPKYFYSSADINDLRLFSSIAPAILSRYKAQHKYGWQAGYQYLTQPYVDQQVGMRIQATSNKDGYHLDNSRITLLARQFYEGNIFAAQLVGKYAFSDDDRSKALWQPVTQLSWQKWFTLNQRFAAKLELSWEKNWRLDEHSFALQLRIGNTRATGFTPYSFSEQPFKRLSDIALISQDNNE